MPKGYADIRRGSLDMRQMRVGSSKIDIFLLLAVDISFQTSYIDQNYYVWVCSPPMAFHRHRNRWPWMTLNGHFVLNTVFWVESFSMDALDLRHDCSKIDGDAYILSAAKMWPTVCGFCQYADIRRGSLVRWCQTRVWSSKMRVFSFDRYIFRMQFPTGFTYRNLHG